MNRSIAYENSRHQLIRQLVYFDEKRSAFLDQYFPNYSKERTQTEQLLGAYSETLERILHENTPDSLNGTVLIGSRMRLDYLDDGSAEEYTIVFPHQADPYNNWISFLSPIGSQLLMARHNGTYSLDVPSGAMKVQIAELKYYHCSDL